MKIQAEFIFPGILKDEAIICYLCKNFDITVKIWEASFSTDTGWAILILEGGEEGIKSALGFLSRKRVEVKNKQKIE